MRKKIVSLISCLFIIGGIAFAEIGDEIATDNMRVKADGYLYVKDGFPSENVFIDVPAASTNVILSAAGAGTPGYFASTATLVSGGTTWVDVTHFTQIVTPRNIVVVSTGSLQNANTVITGNLNVYGYDSKGRYTSETIGFSTVPSLGVGNVAFAHIDTMTISGAVVTGAGSAICSIFVGVGKKIGLTDDIVTATDMYSAIENGVNYSSGCAGGISTTYDTYSPVLVPDGSKDYYLRFLGRKKD